jgi:hypothetical protein
MSRRRWFQFHLSTLVLLTLAAGALMMKARVRRTESNAPTTSLSKP